MRPHRLLLCLALLFGAAASLCSAQQQLSLSADMLLDADALLMPRGALYGPAINGSGHQNEAILTFGGFQYAAWYHRGQNEDVYLARRALNSASWEVMDTGANMIHGDAPAWDAHNVVSFGVAGDGSIHLALDHHNDTLRYLRTGAGAATARDWDSSLFLAEQNSLNVGEAPVLDVTYPRFVRDPQSGDLTLTFRTGSSGNGNVNLAAYSVANSAWSSAHQIIDGTSPIPYDDPYGSASSNRNAYLNGLDIDSSGRAHVTWTWRESATGSSNHDIAYAYSDDGGATWFSNDNQAIGSIGSPIDLSSPGVNVVNLDRGNSLMNQQTQIVDPDGRVHAVMWSRSDAETPVVGFTTSGAAYYHYFRDPDVSPTAGASGWLRTELPTERSVGSRPDMGFDADGNLYVAYVSPGPGDGVGVSADYYTNGDLIIATASKASRWEDWEIVYTDPRDFVGEPALDHERLAQSGVVSVFVQENGANESSSTGAPLRVLELPKLANNLVWSGAEGAVWSGGGGSFAWDSQGDDQPDAAFSNAAPSRVTFDDGGSSFTVPLPGPVAPESVLFRNTLEDYTLNGEGGITGAGELRVTGGGRVTLANGANTYTGATRVEAGTLAIAAAASISQTPKISVAANAELDVSQLGQAFSLAAGQRLEVADGALVNGSVHMQDGSHAVLAGLVTGSVTSGAGSQLQVGEEAITITGVAGVQTLYSDAFSGDGGPLNGRPVQGGDLQTGSVAWAASSAFNDDGTINEFDEGGALLAFHPEVDKTYTLSLEVNNPSSRWIALGYGQSPIDQPGSSTNADRHSNNNGVAWMLYRNSQDAGAIESFTGANTSGYAALDASGVDFGQDSLLTIVLDTAGNGQSFLADWYVNGVLLRSENVSMPIDAINYVGLSFDNATFLDVEFDNFLLTSEGDFSTSGAAVATVAGDLVLDDGSTLLLDIATEDAHDQLLVGQTLYAGGVLQVALASGAPTPEVGDSFDLLQFSAASGEFESLQLPLLPSDRQWNATALLASGVLTVAERLLGDFNLDGVVDAADYTVWRDALGQSGAGLAADANLDLQVDGADYAIWLDQYGATLNAAQGSAAAAPAPGALAALVAASPALLSARRRTRTP